MSAVHPADLQTSPMTQTISSTQRNDNVPDNQAPSWAPPNISHSDPPRADPPRKTKSLSFAQSLYATGKSNNAKDSQLPSISQATVEANTRLPQGPSVPNTAPDVTGNHSSIANAAQFYNERLVLHNPHTTAHVARSNTVALPTQQSNLHHPQMPHAPHPSQGFSPASPPLDLSAKIQSQNSLSYASAPNPVSNHPSQQTSTSAASYPSPPLSSVPTQPEGLSYFPVTQQSASTLNSPSTFSSSPTAYSPSANQTSTGSVQSSPSTNFSSAPTLYAGYPSPSASYPSPPVNYASPSTSYPSHLTSYPSPSMSYPSPPTSYPSSPTSYPSPPTSYPSPSATYPAPSMSYPSLSTPIPSHPQLNHNPQHVSAKGSAPPTSDQVSAKVMLGIGKSLAGLVGQSVASVVPTNNIVSDVTGIANTLGGDAMNSVANVLPNMATDFNGMPNFGAGMLPDLNGQYQNLMNQYQQLQAQQGGQPGNTPDMHMIMHQMHQIQHQMAAHQQAQHHQYYQHG